MRITLGVVGHPIAHSHSPGLFQKLYQRHGMVGRYVWISAGGDVPLGTLFDRLGLDGVNVTSPFKEAYYRQCAQHTPAARRLGCVNVVRREGGRLLGHNTDPEGVLQLLQAHPRNGGARHAVVLGAGGAARAAIVGLQAASYSITVINRTVSKAKDLSNTFNVNFAGWDAGFVPPEGSLLLSCLPPGAAVPQLRWGAFSLVLEAAYSRTPVRAAALAHGVPYADGLGWLAGQAVGSFAFLVQRPCVASVADLLSVTDQRPPGAFVLSHEIAGRGEAVENGMLLCVGRDRASELALLAHEIHHLQDAGR